MIMTHRIAPTILFCLALLSSALAFVPSATVVAPTRLDTAAIHAPLKAAPLPVELFASHAESSSSLISVETLDPTTILSNSLGGLLGSTAILAVPIVAALAVAGLIAFFIVSYANPADEDD